MSCTERKHFAKEVAHEWPSGFSSSVNCTSNKKEESQTNSKAFGKLQRATPLLEAKGKGYFFKICLASQVILAGETISSTRPAHYPPLRSSFFLPHKNCMADKNKEKWRIVGRAEVYKCSLHFVKEVALTHSLQQAYKANNSEDGMKGSANGAG
eukprot:944715-Amphidinium_carterae.2